MRLQDHIIEATREAMGEAFRYARAVPADKVEWKPLDQGRSVLDLAQELAKCPDWAVAMVGGDSEFDPTADDLAEMTSWKTVAECESASVAKLDRFYAFVREFPDERLGETIEFPFGAGGSMRTFTMAEIFDYAHWNAAYHQGQIAYIQTLFGDQGLH